MSSIRLPAGTHPTLALMLRETLELMSPSELVRFKVRERQAERKADAERAEAMIARAGRLLDVAEPLLETDPAAATLLGDAASACLSMAAELSGVKAT